MGIEDSQKLKPIANRPSFKQDSSQIIPPTPIDLEMPHVRWDWKIAPGRSDKARYIFVTVGKEPSLLIKRLLEQLEHPDHPVERIRETPPIFIKNSSLDYMLSIYDSETNPKDISFAEIEKLGAKVVRDRELSKRENGDLGAYIKNIYNPQIPKKP